MFFFTSPIVINVPTRGLLAVETMHAIVQWLANLNIERNMTSMFVNKKHRYYCNEITYQTLTIASLKSLQLFSVTLSIVKGSRKFGVGENKLVLVSSKL